MNPGVLLPGHGLAVIGPENVAASVSASLRTVETLLTTPGIRHFACGEDEQ